MEALRIPYKLVDEISTTEFYIGTSLSSSKSTPNWSIKKIWKDETVWKFGFPDGNQNFSFIWDNRLTYNYI